MKTTDDGLYTETESGKGTYIAAYFDDEVNSILSEIMENKTEFQFHTTIMYDLNEDAPGKLKIELPSSATFKCKDFNIIQDREKRYYLVMEYESQFIDNYFNSLIDMGYKHNYGKLYKHITFKEVQKDFKIPENKLKNRIFNMKYIIIENINP